MAHALWPGMVAGVGWLTGKLNGNFPAALFGALGGSLSAYLLGAHNDRRNKLREEIAATNNAIGLTINIMNLMLSLKGQHIQRIADNYEREFAEFFSFKISPNPPPRADEHVVKINFQTISMPETMIGELQRIIIEKVTRSQLAPMLIGSLQRSLKALEQTLGQRKELIARIHQQQMTHRLVLYFGLPDGAGNRDETFPDTMLSMTFHMNESLYYSELLIEILGRHGNALRKAYGRRAPKIVKVHMTDPRVAPLMPDRAQFADFEKQFRAPEEKSRWEHIQTWAAGIIEYAGRKRTLS